MQVQEEAVEVEEEEAVVEIRVNQRLLKPPRQRSVRNRSMN